MTAKGHPALLAVLLLFSAAATGREVQQLELDPITIQGRQEVPGTLFIQPWKRIGEPLDGDGLNGGPREETDPLRRDTFRRELELHRKGYSIE